ncbi:hypothetical protein IL306_003226, partial [Fusarium sp. DS 682]
DSTLVTDLVSWVIAWITHEKKAISKRAARKSRKQQALDRKSRQHSRTKSGQDKEAEGVPKNVQNRNADFPRNDKSSRPESSGHDLVKNEIAAAQSLSAPPQLSGSQDSETIFLFQLPYESDSDSDSDILTMSDIQTPRPASLLQKRDKKSGSTATRFSQQNLHPSSPTPVHALDDTLETTQKDSSAESLIGDETAVSMHHANVTQ